MNFSIQILRNSENQKNSCLQFSGFPEFFHEPHFMNWRHYQHTNTSASKQYSCVQYTPNIHIYPLQNNIYVSKVHCGSVFEPGASWLPYYCTPPVCVPDLIGALAVWRQNIKKKNVQGPLPSSQALPGYLITAHHLCAFLM